jgi:hypothetical protein
MLVRERQKLHSLIGRFIHIKIIRQIKHLPFFGLRVDHGDAHALGRQWPQAHHTGQVFAFFLASLFVIYFLEVAKQVFLLRFIEGFNRQRAHQYVNMRNQSNQKNARIQRLGFGRCFQNDLCASGDDHIRHGVCRRNEGQHMFGIRDNHIQNIRLIGIEHALYGCL